MIRKLILSAVIATGTITGLTMTPATADAHPPGGYAYHRYEVLVQCGHAWEVRGTYRDRDDAERAAWRLRHEGFVVRVERC
jgi:hypothetical protein